MELRLTHRLIKSQASKKGGYSKRQLAALGVDWPPKQGWLMEVSGMEITDEQWDDFCRRPTDEPRR